jgi:hypothetical protein
LNFTNDALALCWTVSHWTIDHARLLPASFSEPDSTDSIYQRINRAMIPSSSRSIFSALIESTSPRAASPPEPPPTPIHRMLIADRRNRHSGCIPVVPTYSCHATSNMRSVRLMAPTTATYTAQPYSIELCRHRRSCHSSLASPSMVENHPGMTVGRLLASP